MKQVKLISILTISIFVFSLFASTVSAVDTGAGSSSESGVKSDVLAPSSDIESSLKQLRKDTEDFRANKQLEESHTANATKEKTSAKRQAAQAKAEEARKTKDEKRKAVLIRLLDIQIKQLGNTKERVAKMPNIKADLKIELNTSIDAAVVVLVAKKAEVTAATTTEQLKQLAKDIQGLIKSKRDIVRVIVDGILFSRTNNTVVAAEARLAEIKAKVAELKAAGQDTTALDKLVVIAESKISSAAERIGKGSDVKGAISDLKEAYNNMKKVLAKVEEQPEVSPSPVATPLPTPTPAVSFQCPAPGYVNCMPVALQPGETPSPEITNLCSGDYHQWIVSNCPDTQFTY
jgi:hypothetical protein